VAKPLSPDERERFAPYFDPVDLDRVRVAMSDRLPLSEPPLTNLLRRIGFSFPSISMTSGITFDDVIAMRTGLLDSVLFHELVHTVQYRLLGIGRFSRLYVSGFLSTKCYEAIPLEQSAFELEDRFQNESGAFSVVAAVRRQLALADS
jgi:hypothetical protein